MKKTKRTIKTVAAGVALITLAACSAKLLWSTTWETGKPLFAGTLAVDSANNSYIGGAERTELDESGYLLTFTGVLAKHDAQGKLVWQTSLNDIGTSVTQVVVLNEDYLAVAVHLLEDEDSSPQQPGLGALWLVSARDGTFISKLEIFDDLPFNQMQVADNRLYVVKSRVFNGCDPLWGCGGPAPKGSEITTYDLAGHSLQTRSFAENNVLDVRTDSAGSVYTLFQFGQPSLFKLDAALDDVWGVDTAAAGCGGKGLLGGDNNLFVDCVDGVLEVSAQGQPGAYTSLESALHRYPADSTEPDWMHFYEGTDWALSAGIVSRGAVAANGDLYIAKARHKIYGLYEEGLMVGPLMLNAFSVTESNTVLFKVNHGTGGIAWQDDINTRMFAGPDSVTSYFYYPLAVHLSGDKVRLTYRSFVGEYAGEYENNCVGGDDFTVILNTCILRSTKQRYAKTQDYRAADGKRLQDVRYEVPYPRAVVQDGTGSLVLAGDDMKELLSFGAEFYTWGFAWEMPHTDQSQIYLQKSKP